MKYLLDKLEWPDQEPIGWNEWLKMQHFFELGQSRLDDVARDLFHNSLRKEQEDRFTLVHGWLADYFKVKSDSYANPESSYQRRYENKDWLKARSEYLYHRLFARQVDETEFVSHLLEARYFRADDLVRWPFQWVMTDAYAEDSPLLPDATRKFLGKVNPALILGWAVLEEDLIDHDFNTILGLSREEITIAVKTCLDDCERFSGLARFMAFFCKFRRCRDLEQEQYLKEASAAANQIYQQHLDELEFCSGLFLWKLGNELYDLGRYEEAIAAYDQALAIKPDQHKALNNKGSALSYLGRYEEAIAAYDQALAIKPDQDEALNNKGSALSRLGRYEEAITAYDQALAIKPDNANTHYNKSCCFALSGNSELAITSLQAAISLDPKYQAMATTETDFNNLRDCPEFQQLIVDL
jgi:tetratricopeptide (TPR) repeat protein